MDFEVECGLCGYRVSASGVDSVQAEHLADVYARTHTRHDGAELASFHAGGWDGDSGYEEPGE